VRTPSLLAAIASVAVLAFVLGAEPAHAESWRGHDARGDVRSYVVELDTVCEEVPPGEPAPSDRRRDITRIWVDHGAEDVVIGMALRDVVRHDKTTTYEAFVHTPDRIYEVSVFSVSNKAPEVSISTVRVGRDPGCGPAVVYGQEVVCDEVDADVDPQADRVSITVPRDCLGTPRWVRVGALAGGFDADQLTGGSTTVTLWADVFGPAGATPTALLPPSGPRVTSD
jgi:hypothetical protein